MAEPKTTDISLRAAEVAADVTEADQPQERRRLARARSPRRSAQGARGRPRHAGRGRVRLGHPHGPPRASAVTGYLVGQVIAMAPRLRVRDQAALQARFPGKSRR